MQRKPHTHRADRSKELVDLVRDDEFPLSLFYAQLQPKLDPFLGRPTSATPDR